MEATQSAIDTASLEDQLKKLKNDLKTSEAALSKKKEETAVVEKLAGEANQAKNSYDQKTYEALRNSLNDLKSYQKDKTNALKAVLGDSGVKAVNDVIKGVDDDIADKVSAIGKAKTEATTAEANLAVATSKVTAAQAAFDLAKSYVKSVATDFQAYSNIRKTIEKLEDEKNYKAMYAHLRELPDLSGKAIQTLIEYSDELEKKGFALNTEQGGWRESKRALDEANSTLTKAEATANKARETRLAQILEGLSKPVSAQAESSVDQNQPTPPETETPG